jgi:large subunit ribosomal protein L9
MARTKVLLLQDVPDLGEAGNVYRVAGGYSRNYLIPRRLAVPATAGALKQADEIRQAGLRRRAREKANAEAQAQMIIGKRLLFTAKAGDNDRLYGSVTSAEIAQKLSEAVGFEVDRRKIELEHPIRELGVHTVAIRMMHDISAQFIVGVVRDGEGWAQADERAAKRAAAQMASQG